jgi:hypothetical protein
MFAKETLTRTPVSKLNHHEQGFDYNSPMSMGKRASRDRQSMMWVTTTELPTAARWHLLVGQRVGSRSNFVTPPPLAHLPLVAGR